MSDHDNHPGDSCPEFDENMPPEVINMQAYTAHQQRLAKAGQVGPSTHAHCTLAPATDAIMVRRSGPKGAISTLVGIMVDTAQGTASVALSPADARRIGMAILDAADEADNTKALHFTVDGIK